ncbi:MAG TPA: ATP-binding protein [Chloroflexota bacterium]|nr:ATP-binding protein [Chloroflexota bacterium]
MTTAAPRLVLLCGLPGAGKTTLALQLERDMQALRLCPDEWLAHLGFDLWDDSARDRVEALQWHLAQQALRLGTNVILENGFWTCAEREERRLAAQALGARVELRALIVPLDELWQRIERRNAQWAQVTAPITRAHLDQWAEYFEAPDATELRLYDAPLAGAHAEGHPA